MHFRLRVGCLWTCRIEFLLSTTWRLDMAPVSWHDHEMQSLSVRPKRRSVGSGMCPSASFLPLAVLLFLASATASLVTAQTSNPSRTVWDGVYTEAQAARGVTAFGQSCAGCHALAAEGKAPLTGEPFWKSFVLKTVGELLEYVSANMPNGSPGSLTEATYRDIVALILKSNGFPAGTTELGGATTASVQIVRKDGRTELPANALARVVGCLAKSGADWVVTSATRPERAERAAPGEQDATRPLGNRTMTLKFVVTRLDELAGSRVAVSGLLIGDDGADGINVTTVNRVAQKCP
jgi:mono/diheme cytochrome c family protein